MMFVLKELKNFKKLIVISTDIILCIISFYLALEFLVSSIYFYDLALAKFLFTSIFLFLAVFSYLGIYSNVIRYTDIRYIKDLLYGLSIYTILNIIFNYFFNNNSIFDLILIQSLIFLFLLISVRLVAKELLRDVYENKKRNIIIYGAGKAGIQLALSISQSDEINVSAFIDDDVHKQGRKILDINIYNYSKLNELLNSKNVSEIYIAMPSLGVVERQQLIDKLSQINISVRSLPRVEDLINEKVTLSDVKKINLDDIIKRKIFIDQDKIDNFLVGKNILITGSGGSIGKELSLQCIKCKPNSIIIVDHSEFNLYRVEKDISNLLIGNKCNIKIIPLLVSVKNLNKLENIFKTYKPDIVFHAAAYKHVSLGEKNQLEFLENNILGTYYTALMSTKYKCSNFTLVSTDKAVRPSSIMGASKRFAEIVVQSMNEIQNDTIFSVVRFGNVIGSSGSVVPLFQSQITNGGPVTVTHPEVSRYFMTISEAVSLILLSSTISHGSEVFVLDMGDPIKIDYLAEKLISLSGKTPVKNNKHLKSDEIKIEYVGLKPGEKLHEELIIGENIQSSKYQEILIAKEDFMGWNELKKFLREIEESTKENDLKKAIDTLKKVIENFKGQTDF